MKQLDVYLKNIYDSICRIEDYTYNMSYDDFTKDLKTIDACLMQLEHIGETAKKINVNFPDFNDIPSNEMSGLRDFIAHDYLGIDEKIIWDTIENDLKDVKQTIEKII